MNNILAVDSATKILTIVLQSNNKIYETNIDEGFTHSENFIPSLNKILNNANISISDVDLLICTRGPGSFTGLRISMSTLKGISVALNIPLVSIPTLDVYAYQNPFDGVVLPIIDARKKRFYTALFKNKIKISSDLDLDLKAILNLLENEDKVLVTGNDADVFYEQLNKNPKFILDKDIFKLRASSIIDLGIDLFKKNGPDDLNQGPLYIRKSEAEIILNQK